MEPKPTIALVSEYNFLALGVLEFLLSKSCIVFVISSDQNKWKKFTGHLKSPNYFFRDIDKTEGEKFSYTLFIRGFGGEDISEDKFKSLVRTLSASSTKTLVVYPIESYTTGIGLGGFAKNNLGIVYVTDLIGPRMNIESGLRVSNFFKGVILNKRAAVPVGEIFYLSFAPQAARTISNWLFSFGPFGKEIVLLGKQVSSDTLFAELKKYVPGAILEHSLETEWDLPGRIEKISLETNVASAVMETSRWLAKEFRENSGSIPAPAKLRKALLSPKSKKTFKTASLILFAVFSPVFFLMISGLLFFASYKSVFSNNVNLPIRFILLGKAPTFLALKISDVARRIPVAGRFYSETYYASRIFKSGSDAAVSSLLALYSFDNVYQGVFGESVYNPGKDAEDLSAQLGKIKESIEEANSITEQSIEEGVLLADYVYQKVDFGRLMVYLSEGEKLSLKFPSLLGANKQATYLLLFQNNMELRPTGGFIGSYGLVTFDQGRMTDFSVSDVYSADGQLKGHVEPPSAIKKYLGEAGWFLRDSNWDPDFPTSAKRAEWFLDKETDRKVDGVIAVDLFPVEKLLEVFGPIYLGDYEMSIDSNNLYEKTQSEVHEEFFPGTHKKASFLTALSRVLMTEITKTGGRQKYMVFKTIIDSLEERHIQAYIKDDSVQPSLSRMNFAGEVEVPSCGPGCYADSFGIVEANVGVNKANYFIAREVEVETFIQGKSAIKKVRLVISNSANSQLGAAGIYKAHIRFLIPEGSEFLSSPRGSEVLREKGRLEVGIYREILAGNSDAVEISWKNEIGDAEAYLMHVRKQAGIGEESLLKVQIENLNLTPSGSYAYNTSLAKDFLSRISLEK